MIQCCDSLPNPSNGAMGPQDFRLVASPRHKAKKELVEAEQFSCVMMVRIAGATEDSVPVTRQERTWRKCKVACPAKRIARR